ncbi:hypothetical protein QJS10_CPB17g00698 [Acorus calamus]|uniref:Uncharacterized protein n=1 Tax=Acorus calamus TaxID=4465 RepID=A0AAV9CXU2_ACOCL|nr:hypothetical protein QJS10_CPB17g00698 [Acorus calamus]
MTAPRFNGGECNALGKYGHQSDNHMVDKARVAGVTADIHGAASHYGKLQEKSFGKYIGKAEAYLHQYQYSSQSSHSSTTSGHSAHSSSSSSHSGGGGYGDYLKLAQGLLKKH